MKHIASIALGGVLALAALGLWQQFGKSGAGAQQALETLDLAKVQLIRTPGGLLQVSEMRKAEEFAWQTGWECPLIDCTRLPRTVSKVRVAAHYVYRIPLAAQWRLEPEGDHYKLTVPALQLQRPVAFDTATMELFTTQKSLLSPRAAPNRESALRHLGPELDQRGASAAYLDAQRDNAAQTVREFARKWMVEQGRKTDRRIEVRFDGPSPL